MFSQISPAFLLFIVAAGPLPAAALLATRSVRSTDRAGLAGWILEVLLIWCIVQMQIALLAGISGVLSLAPVVAVESGLLLAGLAVMLRAKPHTALPHVTTDLLRRRSLPAQAGAGAAAGLLLALLWTGAVRPITDFDSLWYHLPTLATWLQHGWFAKQEQLANDIIGGYPYSWEALASLWTLPLHDDAFVTAPNLAAWLLLGVAVERISAALGARRAPAAVMTLALLTQPLVIEHLFSLHVDLPLAALFAAGASLALVAVRTRSLSHLCLLLCAAAAMADVKTSGIAYSTSYALYKGSVNRIEFNTLDRPCRHFGVMPVAILEYVPDVETSLVTGLWNGIV